MTLNNINIRNIKKYFVHTLFIKGGDAVKEIEVIIDTDEIAEFFFQELLKKAMLPQMMKWMISPILRLII